MRKGICVAAVMLAAAASLAAQPGVGLGVSVGASFPQGSTADIASEDWEPSFNWGFYVNMPLLASFAITPSSELYKLGGENATDMALAFKFIVPLDRTDLYAGFVPGLTAVGSSTALHVGIMAGAVFPLVSNLDAFLQAKYKILFDGDENIRVLHANAGVLFRF